MDHFIDQIEIKNFKSIRHLEVGGFKRINLFIGRPNVGKSNILEALSLFGLPYVWEGSKKLTDLVRLTTGRELFHDGNIDDAVSVRLTKDSGKGLSCSVSFDTSAKNLSVDFHRIYKTPGSLGTIWVRNKKSPALSINSKLRISKFLKIEISTSIKPYHFRVSIESKEGTNPFLQPPFGSNLLYVLELMPELRKEYAQWFRQYGLRLVLDTATQSLKVQKNNSEDEVFQLPYSSVADTLQRIIFYKTAVASNQNSVLLFEEPEAHAYPPYIVEFTQEVIRSLTNQFFVVTHSPLIVEEFLTDAIDDLGIFLVDFKDGQTSVRPLTTDEIYEVRKYGIDLFFNNEAYLA